MAKYIALLLILSVATQANGMPKPYYDLGEQLVESLRNHDIVAYSNCWTSYRRVRELAKASNKPIPKEELDGMKKYIQERNQHIASSFKILTELFKKEGELKKLSLLDVSIQGKVKERGGVKQITMFYITVGLGKSQYQVTIDDGVEDNGVWHFMDKPLYIEGGPDNKHISLLRKDDKDEKEKK